MSGRATRHWAQLGVQVLLVVLAAALVQVVADRTNRRIDLTADRQLSLADVTKSVLGEIDGPLRISVFHARGNRGRYAGLLKRIEAVAPNVTTELYDLDRYPERARSLGIADYGRAAVEYQSRRAVAPAYPEEHLVGGILRVLRGRQRRIVASIGHGERAPGGGPEGYARLLSMLETENYRVDPIAIAAAEIPSGTDVLLVPGPRIDLAPDTLGRIMRFLRDGGGVLMLLDPEPLPNVTRALETVGVRLRRDFIIDYERRVLATDGLAAVVEFFRSGNPISEGAGAPIGTGVVLPSARSVSVTGSGVPDADMEIVARTGPTAWAMQDPARARRGETPTVAAGDRRGPVPVMAMGSAGEGRLVVLGDADLASDAYFDVLGNGQLVLNSIAWLAREDSLTGERTLAAPEVPRPLSPLVITRETGRRLFLAVVVAEPALVLLAGVLIVGIRRRRG